MPDFTLVIPTRNRPALLRRQLDTYAEQFAVEKADSGHSCAFPIIIADSSDDAQPEAFIDFRREVFGPQVSIFVKLRDALSMVKTPLVVIGADDDVFDVAALRKAAKFLSEHPDYASCSGQIVTVHPDGQHIAHYPQRSIEDDEPLDRLTNHLSGYTTKWYSMQRTADVMRHYALTIAAHVDETHLGELLPGCLSVQAGKSKALDCFYMVRRVWPDRAPAMTKAELIARPEYLGESHRFGDALSGPTPYYNGGPLLDLWLYATKRPWLYWAIMNWRAKRKWSSKILRLI